ncbi:S8 family serine peptidase [Spirillospora sp. NPDC047279]|uniref:S8 family peptidase n=1 Tax=Spirillospora sp. NPDC047279 TaxID=3155478 RepID=UPI0033C5B7A1
MLLRKTAATMTATVAAVTVAVTAGALPLLVPAPARADEVRDRQQPMIRSLSLEQAWRVTRGAGAKVAVVDSGVDPDQADLKGSVTTGPNMIADVDRGARPARQHGTGMASLIAGHGHGPGGGSGVIGVAPRARILAIRAIAEPEDPSYSRYKSDGEGDGVAAGIRYAADNGADVINLSLGELDEDADERKAIGYAISKGVVVVSAAGNDGDKRRRLDKDGFAPYSYPASYPGVIAVAATTPARERAPFSNRNYSVLVAAPGAEMVTAGPGGEYFITAGTSDACAVVSGIAALIRAKYPKLPPALVSQALVASARNGPSGKYNPGLGFGEVDAARALKAAATLTTPQAGLAGKAGGQRFGEGPRPGPVAIIERPFWLRPMIFGVIVAGVAGAVAALVIAVLLARRNPRPALPEGGPHMASFAPPGSAPPSLRPPAHGPAPPSAHGPTWPT